MSTTIDGSGMSESEGRLGTFGSGRTEIASSATDLIMEVIGRSGKR